MSGSSRGIAATGRGRGRGRSESGRTTTATTRGRGTIGSTTTTTTTATRGREGISTGAIHRRSAATSSTRGDSVVDSRRNRLHDRNTSRATNARPAGGGQQEQQVTQSFNQMISRIEGHNDAARIAFASLGPWTPIITEDLPELSLELAREALQSFGNAQQNDRHHSRFFVPFLCAVQGLFHSQLDFVRRFIGVNNWNILVVRTIFVFQAAGITSENTPWGRLQAAGQDDFYVNENMQLTLLGWNRVWQQMFFGTKCHPK